MRTTAFLPSFLSFCFIYWESMHLPKATRKYWWDCVAWKLGSSRTNSGLLWTVVGSSEMLRGLERGPRNQARRGRGQSCHPTRQCLAIHRESTKGKSEWAEAGWSAANVPSSAPFSPAGTWGWKRCLGGRKFFLVTRKRRMDWFTDC